MKLFVDDIRGAPDSTWLVARTVTEAIRYIARFDFDEISLDHDVSHYPFPLNEDDIEQVVTMCEETFQPVAYYIAAKYTDYDALYGKQLRGNKTPKITLHTSNPRGAHEMHAILRDAGIQSTIKPAVRDGR